MLFRCSSSPPPELAKDSFRMQEEYKRETGSRGAQARTCDVDKEIITRIIIDIG
jgi:hypothetical protein